MDRNPFENLMYVESSMGWWLALSWERRRMVINDCCSKNSCSGWNCTRAEFLFVMKSNLFSIFITCMFGVLPKKLLHNQRLQRCIPVFSFFCSHKLYFLCIINSFISKIIFCSHLFVLFLLFSVPTHMLSRAWTSSFPNRKKNHTSQIFWAGLRIGQFRMKRLG